MSRSAPVLFLKDIRLTFGGTPLLTGADLQIFSEDRLVVVGRNGSGKSTLLKIAAGLVEPDSGERFVQPGTTTAYLPQEPDLAGFDTVLDYVRAGLNSGSDPYRAEYCLQMLHMTGREDPQSLSGGEGRRAALARVLAPEPDILLLDEPTNHLDLPAIEWLEEELSGLRSALLLISHDRRFLEKLGRRVLWVDRGETRVFPVRFSGFERERDRFLEEEEQAHHKLGRQIVREEHWLRHGVSARRKRNIRRLDELHSLREAHKNRRAAPGKAAISFADGGVAGKRVIEFENVSKAFGPLKIADNLSLKVSRGDRLGILGPNGAGKSTLLKMMTGELEADSGVIARGTSLEPLVLDQRRAGLKDDWTVRECLCDKGDFVETPNGPKHYIGYMQDFLFAPEQARTPVSALSGGERGRLLLARGLRNPSNFLVLDEPTNDLDLETLDLLEEQLSKVSGTVLLVSHDRDFLDRIVTSVLAAEGDGQWTEYAGGYSDMLSQKGAAALTRAEQKTAAGSTKKPVARKTSTAKAAGKLKLTFKEKYALETLPKTMAALESEIAALKKVLEDPDLFAKDPAAFNRAAEALSEKESELEAAEEEWLSLEMKREEIEGS